MKGRAPNFEKTGSQMLVQRKLHPKAWRAGAERTKSSIAIAPVIARTESAKASAVSRKAVSAIRQRGARRREGVRGTAASGVTDVRQGKFFEVELDGLPAEKARATAEEIARKVLSNPVIESFRVEVEG